MRSSNTMLVSTSLSLSLSPLSLGLSTVDYPPSSLILTFMVMKTTRSHDLVVIVISYATNYDKEIYLTNYKHKKHYGR